MKTVKFSLNELMSEIDESFIEEVYFHDCNKILKKYSKQKIRQNVFCKTASKHKPLKFTYRTAIIVTVVSVFLCMPVYAAISHLLTSALIDDSNRHLIGTETNDRSYIILKDGVYTNEKGKVVDIEELAKSSCSHVLHPLRCASAEVCRAVSPTSDGSDQPHRSHA